MSITNSLYIGLSGLDAHSDAIGIVGDNIANASTIGFKRDRASFSDLLGGQLGAQRLGGGVRIAGTQTLWDQGSINQTGNSLDLAINGGGVFVVNGNHNGVDGSFYTRDGRFQLDKQGYVVNQQGLRLQGYSIDAAGVRSTSIGDLPLGAHQSPPAVTTTASMSISLDSAAAAVPAWDPANPATTSNYATSSTVYDSLGTPHHVDMYFRSQGGGAWEWHAMVDGSEVVGGTPGTPTQIANGTLQFNPTGTLQSQTTLSSSASFVNAAGSQVIKFSFGDDIASGGTGRAGTTMADGDSAVTAIDIDGHRAGNLADVVVDPDGTIEGVYDNGDKRAIARVALAQFANEDGLARVGDGLYTQTEASGVSVVDVAGAGARGSIAAGALEASNVDLGNELVTLIAYQRAFEANAKTITTADEMMTDVTNLKR